MGTDDVREAVREFIIQQRDKGRLNATAFRDALGYSKDSSMVNQILTRERLPSMRRLHLIAAFFDYQTVPDFLRAVEEAQRAPELSRVAGPPFRDPVYPHRRAGLVTDTGERRRASDPPPEDSLSDGPLQTR